MLIEGVFAADRPTAGLIYRRIAKMLIQGVLTADRPFAGLAIIVERMHGRITKMLVEGTLAAKAPIAEFTQLHENSLLVQLCES